MAKKKEEKKESKKKVVLAPGDENLDKDSREYHVKYGWPKDKKDG